LTIAFRETMPGTASHRCFLRPLERRRLRLDRLVRLGFLAQQLEMPPPPRVLPCLVPHQIRRHREEPSALAHDLLLPQGADERLLGDFLRPVAIAESPNEIADQRLVIGGEETID